MSQTQAAPTVQPRAWTCAAEERMVQADQQEIGGRSTEITQGGGKEMAMHMHTTGIGGRFKIRRVRVRVRGRS